MVNDVGKVEKSEKRIECVNADTDTEMSVIYAGNRCMKNSEKRRKKANGETDERNTEESQGD